MKGTLKYTLLYYFSVSIMSASIILLILRGLQWPLSSEIIIGTTLYIHSLILARTSKDLFITAHQKGLISEWLFQMQHGYDMSKSNGDSDA
ncbi:hypothetical protein [Rhodohalobacter sp. 8-1]|uniref:hypothetical protein n=1 Tax=Rhodohalobacter sp. 8-1 TaxID=3131972 RepID=UPI0030ECEED3